MRTLADVQAAMREAIVGGNTERAATFVRGGRDPERRLAIHLRQYRASLTRALVERFPATVWLVGSDLITAAASDFIREQPPSRPCIAEYGERLPHYLGALVGGALPYLEQFAALEWHLGRLALATDASPNKHHAHLTWALDELFRLYLTDTAPDAFTLRQEDVWLEVRGLRGELHLERLSREEFARRTTDRSTGRPS